MTLRCLRMETMQNSSKSYNSDPRFPYLNKVVSGLYTPGSIVKPFVAYGALAEGIISPEKMIVSKGSITIPNPYDPEKSCNFSRLERLTWCNDYQGCNCVLIERFHDGNWWWVRGPARIGYYKVSQYYRKFGIGSTTGIELMGEEEGVYLTLHGRKKYSTMTGDLGIRTSRQLVNMRCRRHHSRCFVHMRRLQTEDTL